ncbi:MAG: iron transporter [Alphaproteobacteria bacterium]|nr:iron transporter [Alphaproteobacteria bacterium]
MRLFPAVAAVLMAILPARAAVIGGPLLRDGVEIIPAALTEVALDKGSAIRTADFIFLAADIHAGAGEAHGFAEHAFIPYLSVSYVLTKEGAPTFRKVGLLFPVATKAGPRYGAGTEMGGPGTYHLSYIVSPPSSHGMMRQTGKEGVAEWWKPITASWNFTYPMSAK